MLLSLQTPNPGTTQTFPRRISTNHSPISPLHLKKPTGSLRHPPHQENPNEQAERDLVTKQYEEANQCVAFKVHNPLPLAQTLINSGSFECSNSSAAHPQHQQWVPRLKKRTKAMNNGAHSTMHAHSNTGIAIIRNIISSSLPLHWLSILASLAIVFSNHLLDNIVLWYFRL